MDSICVLSLTPLCPSESSLMVFIVIGGICTCVRVRESGVLTPRVSMRYTFTFREAVV